MGEAKRSKETPEAPLSVIVLGASGDLARKKILPALFSLFCQKLLPPRFQVFGFSRTALSDGEFREKVSKNLTCRYVPGESCAEYVEDFLSRCFYVSGEYDSPDAFLELYRKMAATESSRVVNRMFYMAIPPFLFLDVSHALGSAGFVKCGPSDTGWSRAVIEKPFGRDSESSRILVAEMAKVFSEAQTFRIDHYLGKEVIQNLLVLRFANLVFEPIWNREYVQNVQVSFKEDFGVGDRGGYFEDYGIVRDVMQNHLLEMTALVAMERPASLSSRDVRNEKVRVLRAVPPLGIQDLVLGQYQGVRKNDTAYPSYTEERGIRAGSITPTYAAAVLAVKNPRWDGVPFLLRAGKALDARMTEIRVQFRSTPDSIFVEAAPVLPPNALVIRVQPDEAIYFEIVNKTPGLRMSLEKAPLDLRYASTFRKTIPDAYELLLLDVVQGDKSLFIREDELSAAWDIFTPALREIEREAIRPEPYEFGSKGPQAADTLARRYGTEWR